MLQRLGDWYGNIQRTLSTATHPKKIGCNGSSRLPGLSICFCVHVRPRQVSFCKNIKRKCKLRACCTLSNCGCWAHDVTTNLPEDVVMKLHKIECSICFLMTCNLIWIWIHQNLLYCHYHMLLFITPVFYSPHCNSWHFLVWLNPTEWFLASFLVGPHSCISLLFLLHKLSVILVKTSCLCIHLQSECSDLQTYQPQIYYANCELISRELLL